MPDPSEPDLFADVPIETFPAGRVRPLDPSQGKSFRPGDAVLPVGHHRAAAAQALGISLPPDLPVLPYAGTSGYSGTYTSRSAAIYCDASGITAETQRQVYGYVWASGTRGATIADLREAFPAFHHGRLSSALTALHKGSHIARLTETRDRCKVYVSDRAVGDRQTEQPTPNKPKACPHCGGAL